MNTTEYRERLARLTKNAADKVRETDWAKPTQALVDLIELDLSDLTTTAERADPLGLGWLVEQHGRRLLAADWRQRWALSLLYNIGQEGAEAAFAESQRELNDQLLNGSIEERSTCAFSRAAGEARQDAAREALRWLARQIKAATHGDA